MIELMSRYIDKNRSGYGCSMVWHKLYSETDPTEEVKEGVAEGEEVDPDDGEAVGRNGAAVGPLVGALVDGAAEELKEGVAVGEEVGSEEGATVDATIVGP